MSAVADAVAAKKLRLYWDVGALPAGAPDKDAILEALWGVVRDRHAAPGVSQDERLDVRAVAAAAGGGVDVQFYYVFDRDFAAMYDQTEAFEGEVALSADGATASVVSWRAAS
ncbi:MAG: hypothetical protein CVU56_08445 [Deltaproteobacteria bacterium HGW-Deltaproteobacteria-14]|nr:MAG: hypothetical protein CVU56_08445 [Deltaproteobacteria bacterium HGW-Deltaproteobacteria-14]